MEPFREVGPTGRVGSPVSSAGIRIKAGETKILALRKPANGRASDFAVKDSAANPVVFSFPVCSLGSSKQDLQAIAERGGGSGLSVAILNKAVPKEVDGFVFVQVAGIRQGGSTLSATGKNFDNYADPVFIHVVANDKSFAFSPAVGFDTLWRNHPLNSSHNYSSPNDPVPGDECQYAVGDHESNGFGNCMTRFCMALRHGGIDVAPAILRSAAQKKWRCQGNFDKKTGGADHKRHEHHFVQPYDFEDWQTTAQAFVFQRTALAPEPMPGIAAAHFMWGREGVVMFKNYYVTETTKMDGGHIDLWNGTRTGNEQTGGRQDHAFLRAEKIVFWQLDELAGFSYPFDVFNVRRPLYT